MRRRRRRRRFILSANLPLNDNLSSERHLPIKDFFGCRCRFLGCCLCCRGCSECWCTTRSVVFPAGQSTKSNWDNFMSSAMATCLDGFQRYITSRVVYPTVGRRVACKIGDREDVSETWLNDSIRLQSFLGMKCHQII